MTRASLCATSEDGAWNKFEALRQVAIASPPPSRTWSEGATCLDVDGPSQLPGSDEESDEWVMDSEGELDVQVSFNSRP